MKFYYSSYGKSFNNDLGCGTVVKNDNADELSQWINGDVLFYGLSSLFAFNKDLSNALSLYNTFHGCQYLYNLEGIGGSNDSFDNCLCANWFFAGAGRLYVKKIQDGIVWKWKFPKCTTINHMFLNCVNSIKEFKNGCFPSVIYANSAFENTNIESFKCDLPFLQVGDAAFYLCRRLREFNSNLGSLITGRDMFTHSKLSYTSILNIFNKIKVLNNWKTDFADGKAGNVYPSNHPFAGLQLYKLVKSGSTITYVRVFYYPYMTQWCNKNKVSNITDLEGKTGLTLICNADNYKDCAEYLKKNPNNINILSYSNIPADNIGKLTIGYDSSDSSNTTSAINQMKAKFANKGWTVTFIPN